MKWTYKEKIIESIEDMEPETIGFIYKIINLTRQAKGEIPFIYVGKKNLYSERKVKLRVKELKEITDKRRSKFKKIHKESDWQKYTGSNKLLNEHIANGDVIQKEIIMYCVSKRQLNYQEVKWLFLLNVIENDMYYNDNIGGHYFRGNLI